MYAGVDTAAYPGDDWAIRVYNETNIWYLSYYLGGQNAAKGTETWRGHRSFLAALGFGLIPIYVGQQVDSSQFYARLTAKRGHADGIMAALLMSEEGFPSNSVCYLDVEGRTASLKLTAYVSAWIDGLQGGGYRAGVYCDATAVAPALLSKRSDFYLWAVPVGTDIWVSVSPRIGEGGRLIYPTYDPRDTHAEAFAVQYAEAGFSKDPPKIFDVKVDLNSCLAKDPSMPTKEGEEVVPTGQDIVNATRELLGASYRTWQPGNSIPMWLDDGVGDPPPASHIMSTGIECSDLISYGLRRCGLPSIGGTGDISDAIVKWAPFDASAPGIPGAVAVTPYEGAGLSQQGHAILYTGEHSVIQALYSDGVTEKYTDIETAGFLELRWYGLLPGVSYENIAVPPAKLTAPYWIAISKDGMLVANGSDYSRGYYDTGWRYKDWRWCGPKES